jgi:hypothetical protein
MAPRGARENEGLQQLRTFFRWIARAGSHDRALREGSGRSMRLETMFTDESGDQAEAALEPPRCTAPKGTLARDLMTGEDGIGPVALTPAFVAAHTAIGDAPVSVPYDVLRREVVTALALRDAWRSGRTRGRRHNPQVIEVHAAPVAAEGLDPRRCRERSAARFE